MILQPKTYITINNDQIYLVISTKLINKKWYAYLINKNNNLEFMFCTEKLENHQLIIEPITNKNLIGFLANEFQN